MRIFNRANNMLKYAALLFIANICTTVYAQYFQHIGDKEGLTQIGIMALYQDKLGRIWMGSQEGLSIYDGTNVTTYKPYAPAFNEPDGKIQLGNDVNTIVGDENGNIFLTIDKKLFRYDIEKEEFNEIVHSPVFALTSHNGEIWYVRNDSIFFYAKDNSPHFYKKTNIKGITCMIVFEKNILIGSWSGLYLFEPLKSTKLLDGDIRGLFEDSRKRIWIGTQYDGAYTMNRRKELTKIPYNPGTDKGMSSLNVRTFAEDNMGNIWMGTFDGLQKYSPADGTYSFYKPQQTPNSLSHTSIYSLLCDKQNTIWVGSYYGDVNYFTPSYDLFKRYYCKPGNDNSLQFPFVGSMTEDKKGNLWICLDGGGLNCLDPNTGIFKHYVAGKNSLPHNNLKTIAYDEKREKLYIGTHLGGLCSFDINKNRFHNFLNIAAKEKPGNIIDKIEIWNDHLAVADRTGIYLMDLDKETFKKITTSSFRFMDIDEKGTAWVATDNELYSFSMKKPEKISHINLGKHFNITNVLAPHGDDVYVSTLGSGIIRYNKKNRSVRKYTYEDNHQISDYCYNMLQTSQGNILITSDKGITLLYPSSNKCRLIPTTALFMAPMAFGCGVYMCNNNQIYAGSTDGMVSFLEEDLAALNSREMPPLYFSHIQINNKNIHAGDQSGILQKAMPYTKKLSLNHDQNNFSISVSRSNYLNIADNSFEYRLKGYDDQWILNNTSVINYTNMPSGKYILQVRPIQKYEHKKNDELLSLAIYIRPVWYKTWWAMTVFCIIVAGFAVSALHIYRTRRRLTLSLMKEKTEKANNEIINNAKLRFFTNVSHEFRTPLTLIISQVEMLLQNTSLTPSVYNHIVKIGKHSKQLYTLVTELLDFRKMEQTKTVLHISEVDMVNFCHNVYMSYSEYAIQRRIKYIFENNEKCINAYIDRPQMEKVVFNLLSNAFKYTPDGGEITLKVNDSIDNVEIHVKDNGIGIDQSEQEKVFERFYQSEENNNTANPGTGIGLALVKNIVKLHDGKISLQSEKGKGCHFTIYLKKGYLHLIEEGHVMEHENNERQDYIKDELPEINLVEEYSDIKANSPKILLVEDNEDLLNVLKDIFRPIYQVYTAKDGEEALRITFDINPDIIVSDIMMPVMNGIELCKKIKTRIDLCHIPIILLTALDSVEQNINGIRIGADDYITKPFHTKILLARCNNLLRNRLMLQNRYAQKQDTDVSLLASNAIDKKMLEDIVELIDAHLDKEDFEIADICRKIGMSKTAFYAKFRSLTNMTPHEFVLNHKLKIAANKLKHQKHLRITEIATDLGFSSARYFAQCFKKNFGVSPAEYRKEENEEN